MRKLIKFAIIALCLYPALEAKSQIDIGIRPDTLSLKLDSVENIFLQKNLLLLAQRYNIDAQKALISQAKLFPNPTLNLGTTIYQTATKQFFPVGRNGELSVGVSQVILLAGKHNKQVKIAQTNATLSEYQFYDLLRTLKHTLRTDFFNIHFLLQSAKVYDTEIAALQKVTDAFAQQKGKGYISEKEVIRVKAQLYSLQGEYNELKNQLNDVQSELRLLMQSKNVVVIPVVNEEAITNLNPEKYPLRVIIDSAYNTRPDLKIARLNTDLSTQNYNLQKALAVPDLTVQLGYDQQGSYINNLTTLGFGIDLPFLNRNQGNIKSARTMIKLNQAAFDATRASVDEQVFSTLKRAIEHDKLLKSRDASFEKDFSRLLNEVLKNYQVRNISLLDFLDFYDSYKQNTLQINSIQFNRVSAFEDLNFYTGIDYLKN
ncbi:MAG: TolC family protein [Bacteroidota bacterium]|nr:TolC family protein [Bacteroidota bacterium]